MSTVGIDLFFNTIQPKISFPACPVTVDTGNPGISLKSISIRASGAWPITGVPVAELEAEVMRASRAERPDPPMMPRIGFRDEGRRPLRNVVVEMIWSRAEIGRAHV